MKHILKDLNLAKVFKASQTFIANISSYFTSNGSNQTGSA